MIWGLPDKIEVGGIEYAVNADYRDILDIIEQLDNPEEPREICLYCAMAMFYEDFFEMPSDAYAEAAELMIWFINCGENDEQEQQPPQKQIDWQQDGLLIAADINKVAGCDVRAVEFLHWWTFMAYFMGIGEGQLSTVVAIRDKLRKGKPLDDWEKEYYRKNKSRVDLKKRYTADELAERERINEILG
ncbi:MAG: hypothetical protein E7547_02890 [Ruminococcaceae bacterium]|nr:hypothetical protein [Oscillospiraceae bacterium]